LSILLTPLFSAKYSALAGRVQPGFGISEECACGKPAPPACYYDFTYQRCDTSDGGRSQDQSSATDSQPVNNKKPVDGVSLGLMIFVAAYLFRRFIL
jgi:hypothetical protein